MAFKAVVALSLLTFFITYQAAHGNVMEPTGERWGDDYSAPMKKDPTIMDMKGKPMICYQKAKVSPTKDTNNGDSNRLLEQSTRLLTMVLDKIRNGEPIDIKFIEQATQALRNMSKNATKDEVDTEENTELGLELMGIVDRLLQSGQTAGVDVSAVNMKAMVMNDNEPTPTTIPLPEGFDLRTFGLSMAELLNLLKDPSMTFMFESLGLGPILEFLRDDTVLEALSGLDIDSFNQLLISGDLFTSDGQIDMKAIEGLVERLQPGGNGMNVTTVVTDAPQFPENPLLVTFSSMMSLLGIDAEITPDNVIPMFLQGVSLLATANDTVVDALMSILGEISEEDLITHGMLDGMKSLEEWRENESEMMMIFDTIMMLAGLEGNITRNNLMEALIGGMRFVVTADDSMLTTIWEMIGELGFTPTTEKTGTHMGGRSGSNEGGLSTSTSMGSMTTTPTTMSTTTTTKMPKTNPMKEETSTRMVTTESMDGHSAMATKIPKPETMSMPGGDTMVTFQQLMRMAGVEGEVTDQNLIESVITAIQYILNAEPENVAAFIQMLEGVQVQNGTTSGTISLGGMEDDVRATFDRIMTLAGVGEVTEENLIESVIQALRYLLSADGETVKSIASLIGNFGSTGTMGGGDKTGGGVDQTEEDGHGDGDKTGMGAMQDVTTPTMTTKTTTKAMTDSTTRQTITYSTKAPVMTLATRTPPIVGNERDIVDVFRRILLLTGNGREITEDNIIEQTLSAMQFILQADRDTIALILEEFNKFNFPEPVTAMPPSDDNKDMTTGSMKDGVEMVCYPMTEADMKNYMNMGSPGSKQVNVTTTIATSMDVKPTEASHKDAMDNKMKCGACRSDEELKAMMDKMVKDEVSRVFAAVVMNMDAITSVPSDVQVFLSKMANGMIPIPTETPSEPTETTTPAKQRDDGSEIPKWEDWSTFGGCSRTCGGGQRVRSRMCTETYKKKNPDDSKCEETESIDCNVMACPPDPSPSWLEWEEWLPCSATCGAGTATRRRKCTQRVEGESCEEIQAKGCYSGPCPIPSKAQQQFWNEWEEWAPCSSTCGRGYSMRRRTCSRPQPGELSNCLQVETRMCMVRACTTVVSTRVTTINPPTAPVFSNWGNWGGCSKTCGSGIRRRTRTCLSGSCSGLFEQLGQCNNAPCVVVTAGPRISNPIVPTVTHRSTRIPSRTSKSVLPPIGGNPCRESAYSTLPYKEKCIVFHGKESGMKTFAEYRSYCQDKGGDIVRTENVEKWVQIAYWIRTITSKSYLQVRTDLAWIGATDAGERGRWSHPADRLIINKRNFMIWKRGEPEPASYDQCAILNVSSGHAISERCSDRRYAICEY